MGIGDDEILKMAGPNINKLPLSTRNLGLFKKT
jgi:hypothetical protein